VKDASLKKEKIVIVGPVDSSDSD